MPKNHEGRMLTLEEIYDVMILAAKPGFNRILQQMGFWAPEMFNENLERKVKEMLADCARAMAEE